ncbi:MAG TPA: DUF1839 family protein [Gaiellaceae bacterium]|nr:DUF1839 family protein [Gaiellaceae bacterium]
MRSLLGLDPATYEPHALHADDRAYPETNCYADILIELLHARGDEPLAALGRTVRTDFEGDQWTFFKPDPHDLEELFGLDIHEAQPYRPLPEQIEEQLEDGRTLIVELDSWFLPDTESTAYRREHVKSSAVMEAIDVRAKRLHYFHNRGLYELAGDDFDGALRVGIDPDSDRLPPYAEVVRFDAGTQLDGDRLRSEALARLRYHFERRPAANPFTRFASALADDLPALLEQSHADYHAYAFATVRMAGSAFELCGAHVAWLFGDDGSAAVQALARIVSGSKALSFKLARRRAFDPQPVLGELAEAWDESFAELARLLG